MTEHAIGTPAGVIDDACARRLCECVDWARPELQSSSSHEAWRRGDARRAAVSLIDRLRKRGHPVLRFTPEAIALVRKHASDETRRAAGDALEKAIAQGTQAHSRGAAIIHLLESHLQLAMTPARFAAMSRIASELQPHWGTWGRATWGTSLAIVRFIRATWALPECDDAGFVPFLAWLAAQVPAEWGWSKGWDENLLGSGGHNFWVHTFSGLGLAGLYFPELVPLTPFGTMLPGWFEHESHTLFQRDGFTRERAGYHWGTADDIFDVAEALRENDIAISPSARDRLRAIAAVNWQVILPDGDLPLVGDTAAMRRPGCLLHALHRDAAVHAIAEAKWVGQRLDPAWRPPSPWLHHGRDIQPAYDALTPIEPAPDTALPHSGYYVTRSDWSSRADCAFIDAGTRGATVTSHDHAAIFHLILHARGRSILVDNCSGHYGDNPGRAWRKSSAAHNVATVDGESSVPANGEWRWQREIVPVVQHWITTPAFAYFGAVHEGYTRLAKPVPATRRKLFHLRGRYWILIDRFTAASTSDPHRYELRFHVGSPCELRDDGSLFTTGDGGNLLIIPLAGASGVADRRPCPHPLEGYDNPDQLTYTRDAVGHGLFATLLVPFEGATPPSVSASLAPVIADGRELDPWEATGVSIEIDGQRDLYVEQHMEWNLPWRAGDYSGVARLFHSAIGGLCPYSR